MEAWSSVFKKLGLMEVDISLFRHLHGLESQEIMIPPTLLVCMANVYMEFSLKTLVSINLI